MHPYYMVIKIKTPSLCLRTCQKLQLLDGVFIVYDNSYVAK